MKAIEELNKLKDSLELLTDNDIDQHKLEAAIDMAARIGAEAMLENTVKQTKAFFVSPHDHNHPINQERFCGGCKLNGQNEQLMHHFDSANNTYNELKKAQEV